MYSNNKKQYMYYAYMYSTMLICIVYPSLLPLLSFSLSLSQHQLYKVLSTKNKCSFQFVGGAIYSLRRFVCSSPYWPEVLATTVSDADSEI